MFEGTWLVMLREDYVFAEEMGGGEKVCGCALAENTADFFLLGNSFLRGYYSIHSLSDGYLGIVPHTHSTKPFAVKSNPTTSPPLPPPQQHMHTWITISLISLLWFLFISLFFHRWMVVSMKIEVFVACLIWGVLTIALLFVMVFVVAPALNAVFSGGEVFPAI